MRPPRTLGQLIVIAPLKHAQNMEVLNMWQYTAGTYMYQSSKALFKDTNNTSSVELLNQLLYIKNKTKHLPTYPIFFWTRYQKHRFFFFWPYIDFLLSKLAKLMEYWIERYLDTDTLLS